MAHVACWYGPIDGPLGPIYRLMNYCPDIAPMVGHRQAWQWPQIIRDWPQNGPENRGQFVPRMAAGRPPMALFRWFYGRLADIGLYSFTVTPRQVA